MQIFNLNKEKLKIPSLLNYKHTLKVGLKQYATHRY